MRSKLGTKADRLAVAVAPDAAENACKRELGADYVRKVIVARLRCGPATDLLKAAISNPKIGISVENNELQLERVTP